MLHCALKKQGGSSHMISCQLCTFFPGLQTWCKQHRTWSLSHVLFFMLFTNVDETLFLILWVMIMIIIICQSSFFCQLQDICILSHSVVCMFSQLPVQVHCHCKQSVSQYPGQKCYWCYIWSSTHISFAYNWAHWIHGWSKMCLPPFGHIQHADTDSDTPCSFNAVCFKLKGMNLESENDHALDLQGL